MATDAPWSRTLIRHPPYCLGAKNGFFVNVTLADYESEVLGRTAAEGALKPISPSCARKLIEGAVAYAQNLGFAPHPDYKKACRVLGGIESAGCMEVFA